MLYLGVEEVKLRIWSLKSNVYAISIKFKMSDSQNFNDIATEIKTFLKAEKIFHFIGFEV